MTQEPRNQAWKLIRLTLGGYAVMNVAYFPLCHLLDPDASNPFYVRVGGGWQTSSILGPMILAFVVLGLSWVGTVRLSQSQIVMSAVLIGAIAFLNYCICMFMGVLYA